MVNVKNRVIASIIKYYEAHGRPPSIRALVAEVKGLSNRRFYEVFPGGISQACRAAGIPAPADRIAATRKATARVKGKKQKGVEERQEAARVLGEEEDGDVVETPLGLITLRLIGFTEKSLKAFDACVAEGFEGNFADFVNECISDVLKGRNLRLTMVTRKVLL